MRQSSQSESEPRPGQPRGWARDRPAHNGGLTERRPCPFDPGGLGRGDDSSIDERQRSGSSGPNGRHPASTRDFAAMPAVMRERLNVWDQVRIFNEHV